MRAHWRSVRGVCRFIARATEHHRHPGHRHRKRDGASPTSGTPSSQARWSITGIRDTVVASAMEHHRHPGHRRRTTSDGSTRSTKARTRVAGVATTSTTRRGRRSLSCARTTSPATPRTSIAPRRSSPTFVRTAGTPPQAACAGIAFRYLMVLYLSAPSHSEYHDVLSASARSLWNQARDPATNEFGARLDTPPPGAIATFTDDASTAMALNLYARLRVREVSPGIRHASRAF